MRRFLIYCVIAIILITPVRLFVAQPFMVAGDSMEPDFMPNDYLIVDELSYRLHEPERGDVIIFGYPLDPDQIFIKRIVGLPGETVRLHEGKVSVMRADGQTLLLDEPYLYSQDSKSEDSTTFLHRDEYFVLGDNRAASADSRVWGPVTKHFIIGRAWMRLFPLTRASFLPGAIEHVQ